MEGWDVDESSGGGGSLDGAQSELNLGDTSQDVDKNTSTQNLPTIDIDRLHLAFHKKEKKQSGMVDEDSNHLV